MAKRGGMGRLKEKGNAPMTMILSRFSAGRASNSASVNGTCCVDKGGKRAKEANMRNAFNFAKDVIPEHA